MPADDNSGILYLGTKQKHKINWPIEWKQILNKVPSRIL